MNKDMGVLLTMEPNYEDFSCQVVFVRNFVIFTRILL